MSKIAIVYKNFAANKNISHIGLGVAAMHNSKSLFAAGVHAEVWPITTPAEIASKLRADSTFTHVVTSAPWIPSASLQQLTSAFPLVRFAMNSHSNVGFLQADTNGVRLIREAMEIESATHNFHLAGNSAKFCNWIMQAFGKPCTYLPNMYYLNPNSGAGSRPAFQGGTLKIGAFGATRPQKNFMSAAGAALSIARSLKVDTELWLSAGRAEGGGDVILRSMKAMLDGVPGIRIVENGWASWPKFKEVVGTMHLLLQPSYTESFNMVTADGVDAGVPSVVSDAITWAPAHWQARMDDVSDMARVGVGLLADRAAGADGIRALRAHNAEGLQAWRAFLQPLL